MFMLILSQIIVSALGKDILPSQAELWFGKSNVQARNQVQNEILKFQFLYEARCPYSVSVYTEQMEDAVHKLGPYLDITTYPFGNAYLELNSSQLKIKCQHGEAECYGNMLHACAIDALKDVTKYIPFNACMMRYTYNVTNDEAADKCGKKLSVDSKAIKDCAKNIRGFELLLHYGIESSKFKYNGVPCWFINDVIIDDDKTLYEQLCAAFRNPPEICKST